MSPDDTPPASDDEDGVDTADPSDDTVDRTDDADEGGTDGTIDVGGTTDEEVESVPVKSGEPGPADVRAELDRQRERASGSRAGGRDSPVGERDSPVGGRDDGIVDALSWWFDTETRARVYVRLRRQPWSTVESIAEGTGIYPSTVRRVLAELYDDRVVERRARGPEAEGPDEYAAVPPGEVASLLADRLGDELDRLFEREPEGRLDDRRDPDGRRGSDGRDGPGRTGGRVGPRDTGSAGGGPVSIDVEEPDDE
jgi:DNA-binding transcriptional ArsR family regulator